MKKVFFIMFCILIFGAMPVLAGNTSCTAIKDGLITYPAGHYLAGQPLTTGYDPYGYNYQAHMFNGLYPNAYLGSDGLPPFDGNVDTYLTDNPEAEDKLYWYPNVQLMMKWNDEWLSNKYCDDNGELDRPDNEASFIGSGAWVTYHMAGTYQQNGNDCQRTSFAKIIAVPEDATKTNNVWYASDGTEIGLAIWDVFAAIEFVYNDPCGGYQGILYLSPAGPGFGKY